MIKVYTLASPCLISDDAGFQSITNYVGVGDLVPLFDPIAYFKAFFNIGQNPVVWVGSYSSLLFHAFSHEHYSRIVDSLGALFIEMYAEPS